jgi:hypothetical protein
MGDLKIFNRFHPAAFARIKAITTRHAYLRDKYCDTTRSLKISNPLQRLLLNIRMYLGAGIAVIDASVLTRLSVPNKLISKLSIDCTLHVQP